MLGASVTAGFDVPIKPSGLSIRLTFHQPTRALSGIRGGGRKAEPAPSTFETSAGPTRLLLSAHRRRAWRLRSPARYRL